MKSLRTLCVRALCSVFVFTAVAANGASAGDVVVNDVALSPDIQRALEAAYSTPIAPGRYWYDPMSGAWGHEGGPLAGQLHPGLRLGGPLRADASRGNTGVFINGRQLHALDVAALSRCTTVIPGRYWVAANGVGGFEGGPPVFDLAALCGAKAQPGGSPGRCENYGGGRFNCAPSTPGIGMIGEGKGKGAVVWGGKVITTPN